MDNKSMVSGQLVTLNCLLPGKSLVVCHKKSVKLCDYARHCHLMKFAYKLLIGDYNFEMAAVKRALCFSSSVICFSWRDSV